MPITTEDWNRFGFVSKEAFLDWTDRGSPEDELGNPDHIVNKLWKAYEERGRLAYNAMVTVYLTPAPYLNFPQLLDKRAIWKSNGDVIDDVKCEPFIAMMPGDVTRKDVKEASGPAMSAAFNRADRARYIVYSHINENRKIMSEKAIGFDDVLLVWFCKTLMNWKALVITTLPDSTYYEVIYDGEKRKTYLDVYVKAQNIVIPDSEE